MKSKISIALAVFAALALLAAVPAGAAPAPTAAGDIPLAEEFWGGPPTGCSSVAVTILAGPLIEEVGGEATTPTPGAEPIPCELMLHEVEPATGITAELACLATVHEEGHLHGQQHSADPANIMYWHAEAGEASVKASVCVEPPSPARTFTPQRQHHHHRRFARREAL